MSTSTTKTANSFETTLEVCCHRVAIRYWDFDHELTDELAEVLTEEGESRAKECIVEGCQSGDLNCCYVGSNGSEEEIWGSWEILRP